ncbi:MAG: WD40 repeat domain-containing protein, partial [Acidobacteria bacterium]|nr:WD40 repeat domain-containing protein [Acidobacteriota bacterium]
TIPDHKGWGRAIVYHPDGHTLVTKSVCDICFWSLQPLAAAADHPQATVVQLPLMKSLKPPDLTPLCLAYSPDGLQLAIGTEEGPVMLWDVEQERLSQLLRGHTVPIVDVAYSPDGQLVASSSRDATVRIWDVATGQLLDILRGHFGTVWDMRISSHGEMLVSGGTDGIIRLWELSSKSQRRSIRTFRGDLRTLYTLAVSAMAHRADQIFFAAGGSNGRCYLWQIDQPNRSRPDGVKGDRLHVTAYHVLSGHKGAINSLAFRPHSSELITACHDTTLRVWDVERSLCRFVLQEHMADLRVITYSPQGTMLASGSGDGVIHLWHVDTWGHHQLFQTIQESCAAQAMAIHPSEERMIYSLTNRTIVLWDIQRGAALQRIEMPSAVWSFALDANWHRLIAGHGDGHIELWKLVDDKLVIQSRSFGYHGKLPILALHFNPTDELVVSCASNSTICVMDPATGEVLHQLDVMSDGVNDIAFLPNSNILLAACFDGAVRIYDIEVGVLLDTLNVAGPYEGMDITGVTGISEAQRASLKALGAVEF